MIGPAPPPSEPASTNRMNLLLELGFKSVLDALPCYITLQDSDFSILYANQTLLNDFGKVVGKTCHLLFKNSNTPCTLARRWRPLKTNKSMSRKILCR